MNNEKQPDYTMKIALTTLRHLGIGLYSSIPAVLSEVVANSYDADATTVNIDIDRENGTVTIVDDGWGMTKDDLNNKFLNVGYSKRESESAVTPKGRHVMGRKGIGKLALFSIAETVEVQSAKKTVSESGDSVMGRHGFVMKSSEIEHAIRSDQQYHPTAIPDENLDIKSGTKIVLKNLNSSLGATESFLRKRLSRRFSVIGPENNFSVIINNNEIGIEDRDYFGKLEYIWHIGEGSEKYKSLAKNATKDEHIDGNVDLELGYKVTGWIGTIDEQKNIEEGNNSIVILAWGKLIHEDILKDMKESGVYANYLMGEIRADFLDDDTKDDIATSDRQSLKETDPRFAQLKEYIRSKVLKNIQSKWTDWRTSGAEEKATQNPKVKEWFQSLNNDNKKYARSLFGKIESFPIKDAEYKRQLYKHGILAFQTLAMRQNLSVLESISSESDLKLFADIFASVDELEAVHYYEIVKGRLEVLKGFETIANTAKERVVQGYIFNHLWLLDPSWERASTDKIIEERVMTSFGQINANLTQEELEGRIDIRYRTAADKHIIIELKKGDRKITVYELAAQVNKYISALRKCLLTIEPNKQHVIEAICLVGDIPAPSDNIRLVNETLAASSARFLTYDNLITQTRESYSQYLEADKKISKIQDLIDSI